MDFIIFMIFWISIFILNVFIVKRLYKTKTRFDASDARFVIGASIVFGPVITFILVLVVAVDFVFNKFVG